MSPPIGLLQSIPPPALPFETIGVDHLGLFKQTTGGNVYILVFIDYLTRWVSTMAVADISVAGVINELETEILCRHGIFNRVITDPGLNFKSNHFSDIRTCLRTSSVSSTGIQLSLATCISRIEIHFYSTSCVMEGAGAEIHCQKTTAE